MTFDPDQCMKIKASGKCDDGGWWTFSSKSPLISSGIHETMQEAHAAYRTMLIDYMGKVWSIEPERILLYEEKIKANHVGYFTDKEGIVHKTINDEDIRISLVFCIQERELNRKLDEFFTSKETDTILQASNLEHAGQIVDTITKITEIAEEAGFHPETIFNAAIAELQRKKSAKSVFERALPELEKLGEEHGFTVSLQNGVNQAGEEA